MTADTSYRVEGKDRRENILILCDHATNFVPSCVNGGDLGLPTDDMKRHIAYDIGALGMAHHLGNRLNAPVISSCFSRLVIDPNRGEDDPTLLMRLYDGTIIPANAKADNAEKERRLAKFHRPYHTAIANLIATLDNPVLVAVHSFTPQLKGRAKRPWEIGILFAEDRRLSDPLITRLQQVPSLTVGKNQPYSGSLPGDTMDQHGIKSGLRHALIEVRNDLISTQQGQIQWAQILADALYDVIN